MHINPSNEVINNKDHTQLPINANVLKGNAKTKQKAPNTQIK